tara:strand:- start:77 stop:322 length:246 start_codon:yes stop_codon:yes gene_type:complete
VVKRGSKPSQKLKKYLNLKWENFKIEDKINKIEAYKEHLREGRLLLLDYEKGSLYGWEKEPLAKKLMSHQDDKCLRLFFTT